MAQFCSKCMPKYIGTKKTLGEEVYNAWWNGDVGICEGCTVVG